MIRCDHCDEYIDVDVQIDALDEIADLLAEAARSSPHARKAYSLLRDQYTTLPTIEARQMVVAGRMGLAA